MLHPWLKWGAAALAVINLAVLLLFSDRIFGMGRAEPFVPEQTAERIPTAEILFSDETVVYGGTGMFLPMSGVTARDADGTDLTARVTVSVERAQDAGDPLRERSLTYSVPSRNGISAKAVRTLVLENYRFPSVTFTGAGTAVSGEALRDPARYLIRAGLLSADDGFGHDITDAVSVSFDTAVTGPGTYTVTITAENFLGDTAEVHSVLYADGGAQALTLRLTTDTAAIPVGTAVSPYDFLAEASSPEYGDMTALVQIEGSVDSSRPGIYRVVYRLEDPEGRIAEPGVLYITVTP